jgi:hypothetical protein
MGERRDVYISFWGNSTGKRPLGKSTHGLGVRSKWIFRKRNRVMDWADTANSRRWKRKLVNVIMKLMGCIRCGELLD